MARPGPPAAPGHVFRGEVSRFGSRDMGLWRGGQWRHDQHHGRFGWWWVVGGAWYYYPSASYPYPPYVSDEYYEDEYAAPSYWYYCDYPPGYYPYVQTCTYPWRPVAAQPAPY